MTLKKLREAYDNFFTKSEEGQYLVAQITKLVTSNREKAEDTGEIRYLNQAKGNREVLELIENVLKTKKGER